MTYKKWESRATFESTDVIHYRSKQLTIGTFYCPPWHPQFNDSGPIGGWLIVFPHSSVIITQEGRKPFVADLNTTVFYNQHQTYRRDKLSEKGDLSHWFSFHPDLVMAALEPYDPSVCERPRHPFPFTHTLSHPALYLQHYLFTRLLAQNSCSDALFVEETANTILRQLVDRAYQQRGIEKMRVRGRVPHHDLINEVRAYLALHFQSDLSLEQIAQIFYISPYHLCRLFKKQTGVTIHHYLNQLRLRTSLDYVAQPDTDLTTLGIQLGYASHSHFTYTFRKTFHTTPSQFRAQTNLKQRQELKNALLM